MNPTLEKREKTLERLRPKAKMYVATIDTVPEYKICWHYDQPRNLRKLIPLVKENNKVTIGNYCTHYRGFFRQRNSAEFMIDIGANIGLSAFPVASLGHKVVCFEPTPINIEILKHAIQINNFSDLVRVEEVAISNNNGSMTIFVPEGRADNASLNLVCSDLNLRDNTPVPTSITAVTFDHWWNNHSKDLMMENARLFKVDTQGHELSVLNGATEFLSEATQYENIILEIEWDHGFLTTQGIDGEEILNKIHQLGYEVYMPRELAPRDFKEFTAQNNHCDLLCRTRS